MSPVLALYPLCFPRNTTSVVQMLCCAGLVVAGVSQLCCLWDFPALLSAVFCIVLCSAAAFGTGFSLCYFCIGPCCAAGCGTGFFSLFCVVLCCAGVLFCIAARLCCAVLCCAADGG